MAKDVDATLRKIVQEQGGKSLDQANEYVEKLKSDKRYKRDVVLEIRSTNVECRRNDRLEKWPCDSLDVNVSSFVIRISSFSPSVAY